jgi:hypothetical protein
MSDFRLIAVRQPVWHQGNSVAMECTRGGFFTAAERPSRRNISTLPIIGSIATDVMRSCAAAGKLPRGSHPPRLTPVLVVAATLTGCAGGGPIGLEAMMADHNANRRAPRRL